MGKLEDITRRSLAEKELQRQRDDEQLRIRLERDRTEMLNKQKAREAFLALIVDTIIAQFLTQAEAQSIPGDGLVSFTRRKRRLGFLWKRDVPVDEQLAYWLIAKIPGHTGSYYSLTSDGRVESPWPNSLITRVAMVRAMFFSSNGLIRATTRDVVRSYLDNPAFDDGFCQFAFDWGWTKLKLEGLLSPRLAPTTTRRQSAKSARRR